MDDPLKDAPSDIGETGERRPPGRPRCESARKAILHAAYDLLRRDGLRTITMDSLARAAGVSKATIYRWWPSKEAVLMEGYLDAVQPRVTVPNTSSALADLQSQLHKVLEAMTGPDGEILCQIIACSQYCPEIKEAFRREVQGPRRADTRMLLQRAVELGEIRPDVDPEVAIDTLYGPLFHRLLTGFGTLDPEFADRVFQHFVAATCPRD